MKKILSVLLILACLLALSACGGDSPAAPAVSEQAEAAPETAAPADSGTVITLTGGGAEIAGGGARVQGGTVTISAVGTYTLSGKLDEGQIIVDTGDDAMDVTLVLDGASISNSAGPAIQILQAKNLRLQLRGENRLQSGVRTDMASFDGTASGAALFSEDDLDIEGEGSLEILGYLNNGITCKDDLDINSGTITVTAANNGIRGSESVEIKGGTVTVSCGNDGVKASSAKKEGKGYVEVKGGTLNIVSDGDGISAASDLSISGGSVVIVADKQALQAAGALRLGACELRALSDSRNQAEPASSDTPYLFCPMTGSDGDTLSFGGVSFVADGDYKTILYASSALKAGETVELSNGRSSVTAVVK